MGAKMSYVTNILITAKHLTPCKYWLQRSHNIKICYYFLLASYTEYRTSVQLDKKKCWPLNTATAAAWAANMPFLQGCTSSLSSEDRFETKEKEVVKTTSSSDVATNSVQPNGNLRGSCILHDMSPFAFLGSFHANTVRCQNYRQFTCENSLLPKSKPMQIVHFSLISPLIRLFASH